MSELIGQLRQAAITIACTLLRPIVAVAPRRKMRHPPARIIVFRRCCLGDTLMMTPLLAALDTAYPAATITYAVGKWSAAGLTGNPHLDHLLLLPDKPSWRDWVRIIGKVRLGRFDLAVIPERSPLPALALALAGVPQRVGLDSAGRGFALTRRVPVREIRHETDLALDLAQALGLAATTRRPHYQPTAAAMAQVEQLLMDNQVQPPIFIIHPGGGSNPGVTMDAKRWPAERFAAVAATLQASYGGTVVIVGAASDRPLVDATQAALPTPAVDLCERLTLPALAALCTHATLYLGNDAGTTHLAEAAGAPVVAIFGPTDPAQYGPTDQISEAVWDPQTCGPGLQRGDLTRSNLTALPRVIDTIAVEQVLAATERVLSRAKAR